MNSDQNKKSKDVFSNIWKKTADISKKAADGAKEFAEQTKQNIYDAQAKKYISVSAKEFRGKSFNMPDIIDIVDDAANRKFITDIDAIGWIEQHKGVDVLHLYEFFVKKSNLIFVPVAQRGNVYCKDKFDSKNFIVSHQIFEKSTEEKLAELNHIAYCLGAKSCAVEIMESEAQFNSLKIRLPEKNDSDASLSNTKMQSAKRVSRFEGHDEPKEPMLKWFAHDENIKGLIDMRINKAIKSDVLELKGSSSATMSKKVACAIDNVMNISGKISMEANAIKEFSKILIYEIEF